LGLVWAIQGLIYYVLFEDFNNFFKNENCFLIGGVVVNNSLKVFMVFDTPKYFFKILGSPAEDGC